MAKKFQAPKYSCLVCGTLIGPLNPDKAQPEIHHYCWDSGYVTLIHPGYGSIWDTHELVLALCDECITTGNNMNRLVNRGSFLSPNGAGHKEFKAQQKKIATSIKKGKSMIKNFNCPECRCNDKKVRLKHFSYFEEYWGGTVTRHDLYRCPECKDEFISTEGRPPQLAAEWVLE